MHFDTTCTDRKPTDFGSVMLPWLRMHTVRGLGAALQYKPKSAPDIYEGFYATTK